MIGPLLTIVKTWKQLKCPSIDSWLKIWYMYLKNEILPFAATWLDLENIILSEEVRQRKRNVITYMWHLKK